jgi:hypothetical protein
MLALFGRPRYFHCASLHGFSLNAPQPKGGSPHSIKVSGKSGVSRTIQFSPDPHLDQIRRRGTWDRAGKDYEASCAHGLDYETLESVIDRMNRQLVQESAQTNDLRRAFAYAPHVNAKVDIKQKNQFVACPVRILHTNLGRGSNGNGA